MERAEMSGMVKALGDLVPADCAKEPPVDQEAGGSSPTQLYQNQSYNQSVSSPLRAMPVANSLWGKLWATCGNKVMKRR
jgi:hypothetical protein